MTFSRFSRRFSLRLSPQFALILSLFGAVTTTNRVLATTQNAVGAPNSVAPKSVAMNAKTKTAISRDANWNDKKTTPLLVANLPAAPRNSALILSSPKATIAAPVVAKLAKFEPSRGCYIGAFIEKEFAFQYKNSDEKIEEFEQLTRKKHASYFTYVGYGTPFPGDWVASVKREGGAPQIAFEPNHGLDEVKDSPYLRAWARDAARSGVPIFLRWASEMNGTWMKYSGSPATYKDKFRLVAKIMREEAPNVAMVWTPFAEPQRDIPKYYPGDDAVDWVGINIYSVYVNDGDPNRPAYNKDPLQQLRFIYDTYSARKPIHISEFAATVQCKGTGLDTVDFAISKMTRFYLGLKNQFPRVKAVNWFCLDTIRAGLANNNYSFLQNGRVLNVYSKIVGDPYFLSKVVSSPADFAKTVKSGSTIGARGFHLREGTPSDLDLLSNTSIVAATLTEPRLRGVKSGEIVNGDLVLEAQIPQGLQPMGVLWKIDGRTVALSNSAPFRLALARDRFAAGAHTAQIQVMDKRAGTLYSSPPIDFQWN